MSGGRRHGAAAGGPQLPIPLLSTAAEDFESPLAVSMRRLYTKLRPRLWRQDVGAFMVTSAVRSEGRTTIAVNLAVTIARHKRTPTLLVDADLRRPTLHRLMQLARGRGVGDLLRGHARVDDIIRETPYANLRVVTCGSEVDDPQAGFQTSALEGMLAELRSRFDLVVIDAPPVLAQAESTQLAAAVGRALLVVMLGLPSRAAVSRAKERLEGGGAALLGVVVNNAGMARPEHGVHAPVADAV